LIAACGEPSGPCSGDCSLAIELVPMGVYQHAPVDLVDDAPVGISPPLQGGYVMYVGVRARNVHGLTAKITAALRDPITPQVVSLEQRPVRLIGDDTMFAVPESQYQDLANVPVCSTVTGPADFDQSAWRLEVHLDDSDGRSADVAVRIRPACDDDDLFGCQCACDADRLPGGDCPEDPIDGGVVDAARPVDAAQ
jgi:hypothetical protein